MKNKSAFLDILGISSATLCLIHCIVFPMLTIIPLGLSHNHWIDLVFALIGLYAVIRIGQKQANRYTMLLFWVSIVLIIGCVIFEIVSHHHSNLIYFGAFGLITAHFLNYKKHRENESKS
ncbi:MerC domain-containing protein [Flavobacterium macacae]|uniref:MerC domain-containing protein n=1 Tax=Flavobacterium macacae TaxID=2488993 RepID=A0A3P3W6A2_9FLAO|nr:MerC domain-containing protein [Flavobacterium macacae]RRJ89968.1 MerC domain-containing protein [Flavobacterium macacae]